MFTTARGSRTGYTGRPTRNIPGPICRVIPHSIFLLGKTFAEKYTVSVNVVNVANRRVQLDNSLTFGGFHWNDPRQIYGEFRYRFKY